MALSTSPSSGNLPRLFLENTTRSFALTSKTPPLEGIRATSLTANLFLIVSARPAALGRYPQELQYSILSTILSDMAKVPFPGIIYITYYNALYPISIQIVPDILTPGLLVIQINRLKC